MVVRDISEFLHGLVQFLICPEFIELGTFILQGVEVPFHWRIVVGVSGFAHALCHMDGFAVFYESLRCIMYTGSPGRCAESGLPLPDAGNPMPFAGCVQPGHW